MTDSSGNGHNGTYNGAYTLGTTGLITGDTDTAITLSSGSTGYGDVPYASWLDAGSTALSLVVVFKTSVTLTIMSFFDRDNGNARLWQHRMENNGALSFIKIGGTGGVVTSTTPANGYNDGNKHVFGATYDGSNIRLYVDGTKVRTTAAAGNLGTAHADLSIGHRLALSSTNQFGGVLDEHILWNSVLSDTDMANIAAAS